MNYKTYKTMQAELILFTRVTRKYYWYAWI